MASRMIDEIVAIINRYQVRSLYRASTAAGVPRYAVFGAGKVWTGPLAHDEAKREADLLVATEIIELFHSKGTAARGGEV